MGAADRPARQPNVPQLYEAGPASGRIHSRDILERRRSSSSELDGTASPPVSGQLQQASPMVITPAATVLLRPDATDKQCWVSALECHCSVLSSLRALLSIQSCTFICQSAWRCW